MRTASRGRIDRFLFHNNSFELKKRTKRIWTCSMEGFSKDVTLW